MARHGWKVTFVTSVDTSDLRLPFDHVNYRIDPAAPQPKTFFNPEDPQVLKQHMEAVYRGMRALDLPQGKPDLVVGHMSYGTILYLRNLYDCPFVGYYELLPAPFWTDGLVLRPEFPPPEGVRLFNATYHYFTYLHLHHCDAGYTPTRWQYGTCPAELRHKLEVIHDGVDCEFFRPRTHLRPFTFRGIDIGPSTKVVTYVSRGLESARGFDVFMKVAKKIYQAIPDVLFLIAGGTRTEYGHDRCYIGDRTFKDYVLAGDDYDLSKFKFLDMIPYNDLRVLFNLSDLHVYLTVPYVLSWSCMQALASGCLVLGSKTPPVEEVIEDGVNGLLAGFHDVDALADKAVNALTQKSNLRYGPVRATARQKILDRYEWRACVDRQKDLFERVASGAFPINPHKGEKSETDESPYPRIVPA